MPPLLLTIPEVAAQLGCSRNHVYQLIGTGELVVVDISLPGSLNTKTRVRTDDLERYVANLTRSMKGSP